MTWLPACTARRGLAKRRRVHPPRAPLVTGHHVRRDIQVRHLPLLVEDEAGLFPALVQNMQVTGHKWYRRR